ncbi:MAG: DUF2282 domain-containing protein [Candidatus Thiodiazotropha lotti]|nr:DUF2282 domain-containing protein [Candidatus Thiodiazotropha lotti]MCG8002400.1 DUF2282 domain-containing protein [Candidatus Thiodiazotropha lotti]MCG8006286.1 DUF2282 domain-containing protein [Candidatus Thiodiazotropha lotti]MCW4186019.1 DUF2282 domain-containing protein [Candidatus Thiodiazotropha lotti]MCW4193867.1 DUF2282 domain-containing protein [Candidatus Thiodiazotropha lotti]
MNTKWHFSHPSSNSRLQTGSGTNCASSSTTNAQRNVWMLVLRGTCEKIVGGSLAET